VIRDIARHKGLRALVSAIAGFLGYGGWAYYINSAHGADAAWQAALTQGSYSFVLTLVLSMMMEWLYARLHHVRYACVYVIAISCAIVYSASWSVNALRGTPEILLTILPGALASTVYSIAYVVGIAKLHAQAT